MGYTHYWTQTRDFTKAEWEDVSTDLRAIVHHAMHSRDIVLANGMGDGGTSPVFDAAEIMFNGLGDDSHETFSVHRVRPAKEQWQSRRGTDFCKTARKPYDVAVTACLCYLASVTRRDDPSTGEPMMDTEAFTVSSDGDGSDFLAGLELARTALPRKANQLDIPMDIMRADRWCAPWLNIGTVSFEARFCIDGHAYVRKAATGEWYRFETHGDFASWLEQHKRATFKRAGSTNWGSYGREEPTIWNATGSFDKARHDRIHRAQARALNMLFVCGVEPANAHEPPLFARPGDMPADAGRPFCYSVSELLNYLSGAKSAA